MKISNLTNLNFKSNKMVGFGNTGNNRINQYFEDETPKPPIVTKIGDVTIVKVKTLGEKVRLGVEAPVDPKDRKRPDKQ